MNKEEDRMKRNSKRKAWAKFFLTVLVIMFIRYSTIFPIYVGDVFLRENQILRHIIYIILLIEFVNSVAEILAEDKGRRRKRR